MPNQFCASSLDHFRNSVAQKLRKHKWANEQFEPFVGFGYSAEVQYSSGTIRNGCRAGLVDARVMFKFSTGSRHIVKFPSVKEARDFYVKNTGLKVYAVKTELIPIGSKVRVIKDTQNGYSSTGSWNCPAGVIGREGLVIGTISPGSLVKIDCEIEYTSNNKLFKSDFILMVPEDLEILQLAPEGPSIIPRGSHVKIIGDVLKRYGDALDKDMNRSILGLEGIVTENLGKIGSRLLTINMEKHSDLQVKCPPCKMFPNGWHKVVEVVLMPEDLEILQKGVY